MRIHQTIKPESVTGTAAYQAFLVKHLTTVFLCSIAPILGVLTPTTSRAGNLIQDFGTDLGILSGGTTSSPRALNGAGWIAGYANDAAGTNHAVIWKPSGSTYGIIDLGGGNGSLSEASGINDSGLVAGAFLNHAAVWNAASVGAPVLVNGDIAPLLSTSLSIAINSSGHVAGQGYNAQNLQRAFYWDGTTTVDLDPTNSLEITLGAPVTYQTNGLNDGGTVVGFCQTGSDPPHAFIWDSINQIRLLANLPGGNHAVPQGINAAGIVVGASGTAIQNIDHAVYWDASGSIVDLGTPGLISGAAAINNAALGMIVGDAQTANGDFHGFAYAIGSATITDIGVIASDTSSHALQINNGGMVTGNGVNHAVFYDGVPGNVLTDLGTLGGADSNSLALNNYGILVGISKVINGDSHGFLLDLSKLGTQQSQAGVLSNLTVLLAGTTAPADTTTLSTIITLLEPTLAPALWVDPTHLAPATGSLYFQSTANAVDLLAALIGISTDTIPDAPIQTAILQLVDNSFQLAQTIIADAAASLTPPPAAAAARTALLSVSAAQKDAKAKKLAKALKWLQDARNDLADARLDAASRKYKKAVLGAGKAWSDAQKILK